MSTLEELWKEREAARLNYHDAYEKYTTTEKELRRLLFDADEAYITAQVAYNEAYNQERKKHDNIHS